MINISHPSPTSLAVELGKADKPSVRLDLHVADNIAMGAKMHFPGPWLDQKRASLSPLQQKMFDIALDVLNGKEKPKAVQDNGAGRDILLDRPAYGATTLSIGFEKPMSEVLGFLGMNDGKGKTLLTLGTKLANALSPSPNQSAKGSLMARARNAFPSSLGLSSVIRGIAGQLSPATNNSAAGSVGNGGAPPPLPPRPGRQNVDPNGTNEPPPLPRRPRANSFPRTAQEAQTSFTAGTSPFAGRARKETPPPLPPRPGQKPTMGQQRAPQGTPFSAQPSASSFPHAHYENYEMDPNEAQAAEDHASQEAPRPGMKPGLSQAALAAKLYKRSMPDESAHAKAPRPEPGKTSPHPESNGPQFRSEQPSAGRPRASSAPPPRPLKEPKINDQYSSTHMPKDETTTDGPSKVTEDNTAKPQVKGLYARLGLSSDKATLAEIRKAYKKLALEKHPDKNKHNPQATDDFQKLQKALEVLTSDAKRRAYDAGDIDEEGRYPNGVNFPDD
jgi:hypothetical protein